MKAQSSPRRPFFSSLSANAKMLILWLLAASVSTTRADSAQIYAVNSGGSADSPFVADAYYTGGSTYGAGVAIDTSGVTNPAPQSVYQTERYGTCSYTFPGLNSTSTYRVRLHFSENYYSAAGRRLFNVAINGTTVLTNFDIYATAGAQYKATVQEFSTPANASQQIVVGFQNGAADNAKVNGIEIIDTNAVPPPFCLNVDLDTGSVYTGVGIAPDTGTTWNELTVANSLVTPKTYGSLVTSVNGATSCSVTLNSSGGSLKSYADDSPGTPNPQNLMRDYLFGNTYTVAVSGLSQKNYLLYVFAHGDQANQSSTVTVDTSNGSGSATTGSTGTDYRNIFATNGLGYSYLKFPVSVGTAGTLTFTANAYLNGFQVIEFPKPTITTQPTVNPSVTVNSNLVISVVAGGEGTFTYQWRKGGVNLSNGASGNGSNFAGVTTSTLNLNNAQSADAGSYDVVVTNQGGLVASNVATLTVTTAAIAPSIATQPSNQTVLSGATASFIVAANGTSPFTYHWYKGGNALTDGITSQGSTISGSTSATLTIANAMIADAGSYYAVVANAPATSGTATSNSAMLTVNQAPMVTTQPVGAVIASGSTYMLSSGFNPGSPAPTYVWQRTIDGVNFTTVQSGSSSSLSVTGGATTSGFYQVTATNSAGTVSSSLVYVGIPSTSLTAPTFGPMSNAIGVNPDTPLSMTFATQPIVGCTGAVRIYDASNNQEVTSAAIDLSQINVFSLTANNTSYGVYHYKTKVIQGDNYYAQPIIAVGNLPTPSHLPSSGSPTVNPNQVLINLPTSTTLTYGKTYYVRIDPGVLVDSTGATFPGISDSTSWRFTVKSAASAPVNGTASLAVGNDGSPSDFSTVQGAVDFIKTYSPQPTASTPVTINVRNGIYYEFVNLKSSYVTIQGQSRNGTVMAYLVNNSTINAPGAPTGSVRTRAAFRVDDSSLYDTVQNISIYNLTPQGGGQAEAFLPGGQYGIANHISLYSYQDTLLLGNNFFMTDSYIEGAVDYIWGGSYAYFQRCILRANSNSSYYSQSRNSQTARGYVFVNCTLDSYSGVAAASCDLSRTFTDFSQTIFINCKMGPHIQPQGWYVAGGAVGTLQLWEYQSKDLSGNLLDVSQRTSFNRAFAVSGQNIVYTAGSTSNDVLDHQQVSANLAALFTTTTAFFGGSWVPQVKPTIDTQPVGQSISPGQSMTLRAVASGAPDPSYQWYKNGSAIAGATGSSYTVASATGSDRGDYVVVATNSAGSTLSTVASLRFADPEDDYVASYGLDPATNGAPLADPDQDGVSNKMEFFLGSSPVAADAAGSLPVGHALAEGSNGLVFEFNRLRLASNMSYAVEYTSDLSGQWVAAVSGINGVLVETTYLDANFDHIKVTIPTTLPQIFARLRL